MKAAVRLRSTWVLALSGAAAAVLLLGACSDANRPEGPAERFLRAVGRGTDLSQVEDLGTVDVAHDILGGPMCPMGDRAHPDIDECDKDQENIADFQVAVTDTGGSAAIVPIEVIRKDSDEPVRIGLEAELIGGGWKFVRTTEVTEGVLFPSEGGAQFGAGKGRVAMYTLIVTGAGLAVSIGAITLFAGRRPTEEEVDLAASGNENRP